MHERAVELGRLGAVHIEHGRHTEAETCYREALALEPDYAEAHFKLGNALSGQGRLDEAEACFRHAIALDPDYVKALYNLGNTLKRLGRTNEAEHCYRRVTEIDPSYTNAHNNLGVLLLDQGRHHEATEIYRHILTIQPGDAVALNNLGLALMGLNQLQDAESVLQHALVARPDYPEAYNNLGIVLKEQGRFAAAEAYFRSALNLRHDYAEAFNNLGTTLKAQGHLDAAETAYRRALQINPTHADTYTNLAISLQDRGRLHEAEQTYQQLLKMCPATAQTYHNIGVVLGAQGRSIEAIQNYRQAAVLNPEFSEAQANLVFCLNYSDAESAASRLEEAKKYGRSNSTKAGVRYSRWSCPAISQRLRIGLVSGDLRAHVASLFLESFLHHLDTSRIELIAYPTCQDTDEISDRIRSHCVSWQPIGELSDQAAASLIHDDAINILIDLSGYTSGNRLPVFTYKPAPVQVSWLGYFATTGVEEIDYVLADETGVPQSEQAHFSEKIWYLPDTRLCFSQPQLDVPVRTLPALDGNEFTFGCFQNLSKVNGGVLRVWKQVLAALPRSRLRFQHNQLSTSHGKDYLLQCLKNAGISQNRVVLCGGLSYDKYLAAHAEVDIILDTFPYTGGTTTCEALWMGVPTLTLSGSTMLKRQGSSLLTAAGLSDWIAHNEEDYIAKAVRFAGDIDTLAGLRSQLRQKVVASPLFDGLRFAQNFENALHSMWHRYQSQQRMTD
jgi:predicted O-linked N-acetylglucosamine transferase (SPINDLY family)